MAVDSKSGGSRPRWLVLANHDWTDSMALETSLYIALESLEGVSDVYLYGSVDVEAVRDALAPEAGHGASEIRFTYEGYEVRVEADGTIAVR